MSADFWAATSAAPSGSSSATRSTCSRCACRPVAATPPASLETTARRLQFPSAASLLAGTAAPVLGYGALNALLFVSYRGAEAALSRHVFPQLPDGSSALSTAWVAGAVGGLATWVVSAPTELVKCRTQLAATSADRPSPSTGGSSSWAVAKQVWRAEGLRGFYFGGAVTALRDSVGYGFYFWTYELTTRWWMLALADRQERQQQPQLLSSETARVLLCGGLAGIATWASIFPLDMVKTRVQTQAAFATAADGSRAPLLPPARRMGAVEVAREAYREGGLAVFFRGLTVCSIRAFIVNAVQWAVYEWAMRELALRRSRPTGGGDA